MIVAHILEPLEDILMAILDWLGPHGAIGLTWAWSIVALTAIVRLLTDHSLADVIARAGHNVVRDRFCLEKMVEATSDVYDEGARQVRFAESVAV